MKKLQLTLGYVALVDDEDFDNVCRWRWYAVRVSGHVYARNSERIYLHRLIMNAPTGREVDHINGETLDNRRSNLRLCSHAENLRNQKISVANKYGYRGVGWHKQRNKFRAYIKVNGKMIHLGMFSTAENAAVAYNMAAIYHHGDFARLNDVKEAAWYSPAAAV